jgi:hypothetical protein
LVLINGELPSNTECIWGIVNSKKGYKHTDTHTL